MPGNKRCEPGCVCKKHGSGPYLGPDKWTQKHRDQSREGMQRHRVRNGTTPRKLLTDEERLAAKERKNRRNRERAAWRQANDPEYREANRERNRIHGRRYFLKYKFGLTVEDWDVLLIAQSGLCYLCELPLSGTIHVDHDRSCCAGNKSCGKCVRGLAHQLCNQGVGQFGDDPDRMRKAADALEAANARVRSRIETA